MQAAVGAQVNRETLGVMSEIPSLPVERFARVAREFCAWARRSGESGEENAQRSAQLLAELIASACALGWRAGEPSERSVPADELAIVQKNAATMPIRFYSEIFSNLVVPPEEPVVGDLVDDIGDIYADIAVGLAAFDAGEVAEAQGHWQFWFAHHWGEHATSALRALWSHLADRERTESE